MQVYNEDEVKDFKKKIAELKNKLASKDNSYQLAEGEVSLRDTDYKKLEEQSSRLHEELGIYKRDYEKLKEANKTLQEIIQYKEKTWDESVTETIQVIKAKEQALIERDDLRVQLDQEVNNAEKIINLAEENAELKQTVERQIAQLPGHYYPELQEKISILTAEKEKLEQEYVDFRTAISDALK